MVHFHRNMIDAFTLAIFLATQIYFLCTVHFFCIALHVSLSHWTLNTKIGVYPNRITRINGFSNCERILTVLFSSQHCCY